MRENRFPLVINGFWLSKDLSSRLHVFDDDDLADVNAGQKNYRQALESMKKSAMQVIPMADSDLTALISEKKRMYSAKTPLDVMMLICPEHVNRQTSSVEDLSKNELGFFLKQAVIVLRKLESTAKQHGLTVINRAISYNFHQDPLSADDVHNLRKVQAQTLNLLHFHVFIMTDEDLSEASNHGFLSKEERDIAYDPLNFIVKQVLQIASFRNFFVHPVLRWQDVDKLAFEIRETANGSSIAEAITKLHAAYQEIYQEISALFIDKDYRGELNMPLLNLESMYGNINAFIQKLRQHVDNKGQENIGFTIDRLASSLKRIAKILKNADKSGLLNNERIFLHSPAYTLTLENRNSGSWFLHMSPRIISTGNALHSLGYFKKVVPHDHPDKNWWNMRRTMLEKFSK